MQKYPYLTMCHFFCIIMNKSKTETYNNEVGTKSNMEKKMRKSIISFAFIAVIAALFVSFIPISSVAGTSNFNSEEVQLASPSFDAAWQNYKHAFSPIRDAIRVNDFKSLKRHMPHFRDSLKALKDSQTPRNLKKPLKQILKLSKKLIKVAQKGPREKISVETEKLRQAIDKFDQRRAQGK